VCVCVCVCVCVYVCCVLCVMILILRLPTGCCDVVSSVAYCIGFGVVVKQVNPNVVNSIHNPNVM
jgi:hypothetical protein